MSTPKNLSRRLFLQRAAVGTLLATGGSTLLAACAGSSSNDSGSSGGGADKTADNPFGLADKATVDAVIFNGGYGYDYVSFAGNIAQKKFAGSTFKVAPSTQIAQQLQPRFVGGNPPDLIDNSGANQIGFNTILDQLATLDDVFEANNYEGTKIA
ncbi:MAG: N-acetylglucosamine transport system substrate-binding protein, partial [Kribbellaceae bacterium]|nr:N-acetylglucosamine transport system substrate-binding protein [Kribbellaceae bacterium]